MECRQLFPVQMDVVMFTLLLNGDLYRSIGP